MITIIQKTMFEQAEGLLRQDFYGDVLTGEVVHTTNFLSIEASDESSNIIQKSITAQETIQKVDEV